jgi:hypothetical protein
VPERELERLKRGENEAHAEDEGTQNQISRERQRSECRLGDLGSGHVAAALAEFPRLDRHQDWTLSWQPVSNFTARDIVIPCLSILSPLLQRLSK